jgi:hypothetical protein
MKLVTLKKATPAALIALLSVPALAFALVSGTCRGAWNLPDTTLTGSMYGTLTDSSGQQAFTLKAELQSFLVLGPLGDAGTFSGKLDTGSGAAFPAYTVAGTYAGSSLAQSGFFQGQVYYQVSQLGPIAAVGRIQGQYSDPATFPSKGQFKGTWTANL